VRAATWETGCDAAPRLSDIDVQRAGHAGRSRRRAAVDPAKTALIDRLTWGSNATDAAVLARLGTARWIYRRLHPERSTALPAEVAARIAALPVMAAPMIDTVRLIDDLNRAENALTDPDAKATAKKVYNDALGAAGHQAAERSILLAL
jgi:hypothetical protein